MIALFFGTVGIHPITGLVSREMFGFKLILCVANSAGTCFRFFERLGECSFENFLGKAIKSL